MSDADELNQVERARRANRTALEAAGVQPFAYAFERTHLAADALAAYDDAMGEQGPVVRVCGRIAALRSQGKTAFAHLEDVSGRIQVYLRANDLGAAYDLVKLWDLDDHVGVEGRLFRTRAGEENVLPDLAAAGRRAAALAGGAASEAA